MLKDFHFAIGNEINVKLSPPEDCLLFRSVDTQWVLLSLEIKSSSSNFGDVIPFFSFHSPSSLSLLVCKCPHRLLPTDVQLIHRSWSEETRPWKKQVFFFRRWRAKTRSTVEEQGLVGLLLSLGWKLEKGKLIREISCTCLVSEGRRILERYKGTESQRPIRDIFFFKQIDKL